MSTVQIQVGGNVVTTSIATPPGPDPRPGAIVLHDVGRMKDERRG